MPYLGAPGLPIYRWRAHAAFVPAVTSYPNPWRLYQPVLPGVFTWRRAVARTTNGARKQNWSLNQGNLGYFPWPHPLAPQQVKGLGGFARPQWTLNQGNLPYIPWRATAGIATLTRYQGRWTLNQGNLPYFPWQREKLRSGITTQAFLCSGQLVASFTALVSPSGSFTCGGQLVASFTSHAGPLAVLFEGQLVASFTAYTLGSSPTGSFVCQNQLVAGFSVTAPNTVSFLCQGQLNVRFSVQVGQDNDCVVASPPTIKPKNAMY